MATGCSRLLRPRCRAVFRDNNNNNNTKQFPWIHMFAKQWKTIVRLPLLFQMQVVPGVKRGVEKWHREEAVCLSLLFR